MQFTACWLRCRIWPISFAKFTANYDNIYLTDIELLSTESPLRKAVEYPGNSFFFRKYLCFQSLLETQVALYAYSQNIFNRKMKVKVISRLGYNSSMPFRPHNSRYSSVTDRKPVSRSQFLITFAQVLHGWHFVVFHGCVSCFIIFSVLSLSMSCEKLSNINLALVGNSNTRRLDGTFQQTINQKSQLKRPFSLAVLLFYSGSL